jgi:hypothetical protein
MNKQKITEIEVNGITYIPKNTTTVIPQNDNEIKWNDEIFVRKSSLSQMAKDTNGLQNVLIRSYASGVHFGLLKSQENTVSGKNVVLLNSRRIYYWEGAATLSQLAMEGSTKPQNCKITMEVNEIGIMNVIEIIPLTEKALNCFNLIKAWKL